MPLELGSFISMRIHTDFVASRSCGGCRKEGMGYGRGQVGVSDGA